MAEFIHPGPDSAEELIETLAEAEDNQVIGADSRVMIERVIRMADMTAGDVMVASPRMDMIDIDETPHALLRSVIDTGHSRFPVFQGSAKHHRHPDGQGPAQLQRSPDLHIRTLIRPAVFVPESKGLNDLLREFRGNRNHLAIVIDEFGRVAGLVTIEDVLEQIVGEIEDEFDIAEDSGDIFGLADKTYRVSGDTPIDRVSEASGVPIQAVRRARTLTPSAGSSRMKWAGCPSVASICSCAGCTLSCPHQGRRGALVQGVAGGRQRPLPTDGAVLYPRSHAPAWGSWARIGAIGRGSPGGLGAKPPRWHCRAPGSLWWLQCVSMVVLAGLLHRLRPTWRQGALLGFAFALAWLCGTFWWLFISLHTYGGLAAPLAVAAVVALAAFLAIYYALVLGLFSL